MVLEDGTEFPGHSFGYEKKTDGEVVFNTGMIGYPESLTDPSYRGQILVMTYPLMGNYGVPGDEMEDGLHRWFESDRIQVQGLIVSEHSPFYTHWNSKRSLSDWLRENHVPGLYGIDTRQLTKHLRDRGTMLGRMVFGDGSDDNIGDVGFDAGDTGHDNDKDYTANVANGINHASNDGGAGKGNGNMEFEDPNTRNLVSEVSVGEPVMYNKGPKHVAVIDCGVKNSIIRALLARNITVTRYPWDHDVMKDEPDGILISNGPGDPIMCQKTIDNVRKALDRKIPILGICLGSQILGLAAGARTYKLKYGHRSHNQPCVEAGTKRAYITSQNHGYAIDTDTLPQDWREWFYNSNDNTNEGITHISKPFFGTQFHPEASPGPDDTEMLFDMFVRALS